MTEPETTNYMPSPNDLITAAEELRSAVDTMLGAEGSTDAAQASEASDSASRLLEQVAIALLPPGAQRDELLEGRTDLGQPAVTMDESYGPDGQPLPRGRCDTCGAPCDGQGCTTDRSHDTAIGA